MKLLIDMGNTRVKWQLREGSAIRAEGAGELASGAIGGGELFGAARPFAGQIERVAISTVASEAQRELLADLVQQLTPAPVRFHWTEPRRGELRCSYESPETMGADRWHAMYAGWRRYHEAVLLVDAGSALTMDIVDDQGAHLGGYILPGKRMMLRSLSLDAARINFGRFVGASVSPGTSTGECVHHGMHWLWSAVVEKVRAETEARGIHHVLLTGGDAPDLVASGLDAVLVPDLVLEGLALIDEEAVS